MLKDQALQIFFHPTLFIHKVKITPLYVSLKLKSMANATLFQNVKR